MKRRMQMSAPELDYYIEEFRSGLFDNWTTPLTKRGQAYFSKILEEVKKIKPTSKESHWSFYFPVPRGNLQQFVDFNQGFDGDEVNEEKFKKNWERDYPEEEAWRLLEIVSEEKFDCVYIGDSCIARKNLWVEERDKEPNKDRDPVLAYLLQTVGDVVRMVKAGTYNEYVEKNLPYRYRRGKIKRSLYWKLVPGRKMADLGGLSEEEISSFEKTVDPCFEKETNERRYPSLTSGKYYELCSICYKAAKYERAEELSPKDAFRMFGDERDGGLSTIRDDSSEEYERWVSLRDEEKWKLQNPSHVYQIVDGGYYGVVCLYPYKDERGYYFHLSGGSNRFADVIRMYLALLGCGAPVRLGGKKTMLARLRGEGNLGIVSVDDTTSGNYDLFGDEVDDCVYLDDGNPKKVKEKATWFPLQKLELKGD